MARCEGTKRDGDQCKREAQPDSKFCYMHGPAAADGGEAAADDDLDFAELAPILLAGLLAAGLVFLLKGFGRWIPKL